MFEINQPKKTSLVFPSLPVLLGMRAKKKEASQWAAQLSDLTKEEITFDIAKDGEVSFYTTRRPEVVLKVPTLGKTFLSRKERIIFEGPKEQGFEAFKSALNGAFLEKAALKAAKANYLRVLELQVSLARDSLLGHTQEDGVDWLRQAKEVQLAAEAVAEASTAYRVVCMTSGRTSP